MEAIWTLIVIQGGVDADVPARAEVVAMVRNLTHDECEREARAARVGTDLAYCAYLPAREVKGK